MSDRLTVGGGEERDAVTVRLTPEAFAKPPGGVRRVALELLTALRVAGADVSVSAFADRHVTATTPTPALATRAALQIREAAFFASRRLLRSDGLAHSLYYDQQFRAAAWPLVVTVHDMIHERFRMGSRNLRSAKRLSVRHARLIVTPSQATASDLVEIIPGIRAPIVTIPWGIAPLFLDELAIDRFDRSEPFLLYVGTRRGYKNFATLVRALADAPDLNELRLVLAGGEPPSGGERAQVADALGRRKRLQFVASPSDVQLRRLYDEAAALVVTSRCEGFGLPLLEAMARGCPVAAADGGASAEVADGHAAMFPPDSADACADAIRRALASSAAARREARLHAEKHDWAATARAHVDAYRSLAR